MFKRNSLAVFVSTGLILGGFVLGGVTATAQEAGAPAPSRNSASTDAVWTLEAKGVAQELGLSAEQTGKVVDAYKAARQSHMQAVEAQFGRERPGQGDMAKLRSLVQGERTKLGTALEGVVPAEQMPKALASLGTFSRRWDRLVAALAAMQLEEPVMTKALVLVNAHNVESERIIETAADKDNWRGIRDEMTKLRDKLDGEMAAVLSPEQLAQWKKATAMRGRGRGTDEPAKAPAPEAQPSK